MPKRWTPAKTVVRVWLAERRRTQGWLARRLRVSDSMLSSILAGRRQAGPAFVAKLQELTGVDLTQFPHTREWTGLRLMHGESAAPLPAPDLIHS